MASFEEMYLPSSAPDEAGLLSFGFKKDGDAFIYQTEFLNGELHLTIRVVGNEVKTEVKEVSSDEPYDLYRVESAHGEYVGMVRDEIKAILLKMKQLCFVTSWTKREQPAAVLSYLKQRYGEEVEYPWEGETFGVVRRSDNRKWICLFMELPISKVGLPEDRVEVIMNVRHDGAKTDGKTIFPAYHMNKKSWVSLVLDGRLSTQEIISLVEESWIAALPNKKRKKA